MCCYFALVCINSVDSITVISCGVGCDLHTVDVVDEASVLDFAASSQEAGQGSISLYNVVLDTSNHTILLLYM